MKMPMDEHGQRVLGLAIKGIDALIDEFVAAHKDGAELRHLHEEGRIRWRLLWDEAAGLISLGTVLPTGEVIVVGHAMSKATPDVPVRASTTLN